MPSQTAGARLQAGKHGREGAGLLSAAPAHLSCARVLEGIACIKVQRRRRRKSKAVCLCVRVRTLVKAEERLPGTAAYLSIPLGSLCLH